MLAAAFPPLFFLFFLGVIGLIIVVGILAHQAAKKRRQQLAAWAAQGGWHYSEGKVSSLEDRFPQFDVLQTGDNRYGFNVMRGRLDHRDAFAFDYHYQTYSTDSKGRRQTHHHEFSAVIVDSGLDLTALTVRTEGLFDKMKGLVGVDDIDFESAEFSRTFWVTSPDKRWAYDVLHQETMEYLLEGPRYTLQFESGPLRHRPPHEQVHAGAVRPGPRPHRRRAGPHPQGHPQGAAQPGGLPASAMIRTTRGDPAPPCPPIRPCLPPSGRRCCCSAAAPCSSCSG